MSDIERLADLLYEMWATTGRKLGATETEMRAASRGDAETLIARGVTVGVRDPSPPEPTDREIGLRSALNAALVDLRIFRGVDDHFVQALEKLVEQTGVRGAGVVPPEEPK